MKKFFRNNGLSIVFFGFFIVSLIAQTISGFKEYNKEQEEKGRQQAPITEYITTGHFIEATFENWESEFLQMWLFVWLSIYLYQKGSSESKDPDQKVAADKEPDSRKKDAPWPVKQGGLILTLYKSSLSTALFLLFLFSFLMHWYGSMREYNHAQFLKGETTQSALEYLTNSKLWFESFENWQSEFLSVFSIIVLSIFLRQKGSAQSKAVDAPNAQTGEG
jgi:hypothetical protein